MFKIIRFKWPWTIFDNFDLFKFDQIFQKELLKAMLFN